MKIGEKIRKIREMKGVTQEYLASQLSISPQAFGKIEREETKLDFNRLSEIAKYLEIAPLDIVNFDESSIFNNTFNNHATLYNNSTHHSNSSIEKMIELFQQELLHMRKSNELLVQLLQRQNQK